MATAPSILVIDDEQGILETLRILLKNEGFDVTTAQGANGPGAAESSAPDIVLTDSRCRASPDRDPLGGSRQDPKPRSS